MVLIEGKKRQNNGEAYSTTDAETVETAEASGRTTAVPSEVFL